jgi:hypothetical protein
MQVVARTDKKQSDLRQALDKHLEKFPDSPIYAVVASPDIQTRLARFDEADAAALVGQSSRLGIGRAGLWATMLGTVIGASALLPIYNDLDDWARWMVQGFQALALVVGVLAAWVCPSPYRWTLARARAEEARADVFRSIVRAGASATELLGPTLACFREAHLDWQLAYYRKRIEAIRRSVVRLTIYNVAAYALRALVLLFAAAILLKLVWPELTMGIEIEDPERWQLAFGVMATAIVAFTTARSYFEQESAERYQRAARKVEDLKRVDLPRAEAAAAEGHVEVVLDFCEKVQSVLTAEHLAWFYGAGSDGRLPES